MCINIGLLFVTNVRTNVRSCDSDKLSAGYMGTL